ncbi:hypothetical protein [Nocardia speluncae]|nr:hypothetical protein [Nocardia speluncae]
MRALISLEWERSVSAAARRATTALTVDVPECLGRMLGVAR